MCYRYRGPLYLQKGGLPSPQKMPLRLAIAKPVSPQRSCSQRRQFSGRILEHSSLQAALQESCKHEE